MKSFVFALTVAATICAVADESPSVRAVNQFGLRCQRQTKGNAIISPWSLEQSLAMAATGARGITLREMTSVLGLQGEPSEWAEHFKTLRENIGASLGGSDGKTLLAANRMFIANGLKVKPQWSELVDRCFAAKATTMDFRDSTQATEQINEWVRTQTNGRIPSLIPAGELPPETVLALVNALYFDQSWDERFTKELTRSLPFFQSRTSGKNVALMFKQHRFRYARKDGFQVVAVPYAGGTLQFVVILPDEIDGLERVEGKLTPQLLFECVSLQKTEVRLWLPRLTMKPPTMPMKLLLGFLGMNAAFRDADFSGITYIELKIAEVFHCASIELDEDGTKAAAATATIFVPRNGHPHEVPHEVVRADHPFLFLIQHVETGACLFIGRVTDPAPDMVLQNIRPNATRDVPPQLTKPADKK